MPNMLKK